MPSAMLKAWWGVGGRSYVLFVDLFKAYATVNHALLFGILKKYGIPEELVEVAEIMYNYFKVHVQVGK
jgi:hypothetical protein